MKFAVTTLLIYAMMGPLVGLVLYAIALSIFGAVRSGSAEAVWVFPFMVFYGLPFAHLLGVVPASVAGVLSAALARWTQRDDQWIGAAGGGASFLAGEMTGSISRTPAVTADLAEPLRAYIQVVFWLLMALVHVGAAVACWMVARQSFEATHRAASAIPAEHP